jgi:hypothetical protein
LILYLPEGDAGEARDVPEAFHQHFAVRRGESEKELWRLQRFGWRSLLIALVFLGIMILLVEVIRRFMPAGGLASVLQEGLTILGWVALWRPGELLLYEWYPFKRDAKLFGKLERAEMKIVAEAKEQVNEHGDPSARSVTCLSTIS